ncbi:MAG: tetratricopeptide repeat protein [Pseudomonas sp.]
MAIKAFVYTTKHQLEAATQQSFRHTHVYELLAASFGFNSNAALSAAHVFAAMGQAYQPSTTSLGALHKRLVELGYQEIADLAGAELLKVIAERRLGAVTVESVIDALRGDHWEYPDEWRESDDEDDPLESEVFSSASPSIDLDDVGLLVDSLSGAAAKGSAAAHYALALIYRGDDLDEEVGSAYWHSLMEQGRELEGVQLEWAMAYQNGMVNAEREALHLKEAARLGWSDARLDIALECAEHAEKQGDLEQAQYWYKEAALLGDIEAMRTLAWLAEDADDLESAKHWSHQAALLGDTDAMRALIDDYDQRNLLQNWVWVYLSERLGKDLRVSTMRAYHDGGMYAGQEYDDDQGGPLYVDGDEGVELEPLSVENDVEAKRLAYERFSLIQPSGR